MLRRRPATPKHILPNLAEISIKILLLVSCVATSYSVDDDGLIVVLHLARLRVRFYRTDVSQINKVLVVRLDLNLEAQVAELILNFVLVFLLVDLLEVTQHVGSLVSSTATERSLLLHLNISENLLFQLQVEGNTVMLQKAQVARLSKNIVTLDTVLR